MSESKIDIQVKINKLVETHEDLKKKIVSELDIIEESDKKIQKYQEQLKLVEEEWALALEKLSTDG